MNGNRRRNSNFVLPTGEFRDQMESYSGRELDFKWLPEELLETKQIHLLPKTDRYKNILVMAEVIPKNFPTQAEMNQAILKAQG